MKKENIKKNNKGKEIINNIEKNIKKEAQIDKSLNKNNNYNKNKKIIPNQKRKFCNVIKITKSKYPKNSNISCGNFPKEIILENENKLQTEPNITTYQINDDKINYLYSSGNALKKLSFRKYDTKNNLNNENEMTNNYYPYKSVLKKNVPLKKIKIKENHIKSKTNNYRIPTYKSYKYYKSYTLLNSKLVKKINNRMNLYDSNYISEIYRTENININQYIPKLKKKAEFQGSKTPLNSINKKNPPIFKNQTNYRRYLGPDYNNKNNILSYNYNNPKFYPNINTFNNSPININYYQLKAE
jgi:hypothetical protein